MRKVPVEILKPGMVLARTVYAAKGMKLAAEGTCLTKKTN